MGQPDWAEIHFPRLSIAPFLRDAPPFSCASFGGGVFSLPQQQLQQELAGVLVQVPPNYVAVVWTMMVVAVPLVRRTRYRFGCSIFSIATAPKFPAQLLFLLQSQVLSVSGLSGAASH